MTRVIVTIQILLLKYYLCLIFSVHDINRFLLLESDRVFLFL
jgi:hypothetical protein